MSQEVQKGSESVGSAYLNLGTEWGSVVSATHRPLYPTGISNGFHSKGRWLGVAVGPEGYGEVTISRPHQG
jgi:hypothetical protein